jgi:hypothetical protein
VNVAIVETMIREPGCGDVHCTRLSARTRRTDGTVDVQERPSDMRAALEVRTQLGSERPVRGARNGCLRRAELRVHRGGHGRRVVGRDELRENDNKGARIARGGIGYGPELASCGLAGAEDACWMPGKPGGVCDASSSRLPGTTSGSRTRTSWTTAADAEVQ